MQIFLNCTNIYFLNWSNIILKYTVNAMFHHNKSNNVWISIKIWCKIAELWYLYKIC
jgi:hypothetical protein